jgi:hypothetical protein
MSPTSGLPANLFFAPAQIRVGGAGHASYEHVKRKKIRQIQQTGCELGQHGVGMTGLPFVGKIRTQLDVYDDLKRRPEGGGQVGAQGLELVTGHLQELFAARVRPFADPLAQDDEAAFLVGDFLHLDAPGTPVGVQAVSSWRQSVRTGARRAAVMM